ncbi:MAG: VOC family protein [Gammaproteobacteria bacterium]
MIAPGISDLGRACGFYENAHGFPRMESSPEVTSPTLNGTWLGLYGRANVAKDSGLVAPPPTRRAFTLAHNVEFEEEVDTIVSAAVAAGAVLLETLLRMARGGYCAYFSGLDGHVREIAHNPAFGVDPA